MRFQLRTILTVTLLTALLFAPLAKPSQYWLMLLPTLATTFTTVVVAKSVSLPERVFWTAMPSGAFAYLFFVQFIGYFIGTDPVRGTNVWNDNLGLPLYKLLHGESAFYTNRQGLHAHDLVSFYVWLHVVAAVVLSAIIAFVAHLIVNSKAGRNRPQH